MIDDRNVFRYEVKSRKVEIIKDQNIMGIFFIDNAYLYTINNKSEDNNEYGFSLYNVNNLLSNDTF